MLLGSNLNILIVSPYFHPGNFRINDFAEAFVKRGHVITVLTAVPDIQMVSFIMPMASLRVREKHIMAERFIEHHSYHEVLVQMCGWH